jgi:hypothetical protein
MCFLGMYCLKFSLNPQSNDWKGRNILSKHHGAYHTCVLVSIVCDFLGIIISSIVIDSGAIKEYVGTCQMSLFCCKMI